MAAEMYDGKGGSTKPTQGTGNANGKPIRPVLFGVGAVIALILVSLAISMSRRNEQTNNGFSESGPVPTVQYSPAGATATSATAVGQDGVGGRTGTASRPATAQTSGTTGDATSQSGSSSLPYPSPSVMQGTRSMQGTPRNSAGQNVIAPPGPSATQQQEANQ